MHGMITSKLTRFLGLFFFLSLLFIFAKADINGDAAALLAFKGNLTNTGSLVSWNTSAIASVCSWKGVTCSTGNGSSQRVTSLRLPGLVLYGSIASQTLGKLDALEVLSFRKNKLSGNLPADLANCVSLKQLYLQNNSFSGALPADFSVWPNMTQLDLSFNNFSGEIPASLNNLTHLKSLFLENNDLSGSIPSLSIASLRNFSVAENHLTGSIPSSLLNFPAESFTGNNGLCGAPLLGECSIVGSTSGAPPPTSDSRRSSSSSSSSSSSNNKKKLSAGAVVGIVIGAAAFAVIIVCFFLLGRKNRNQGIGERSKDLYAAGRSEFQARGSQKWL